MKKSVNITFSALFTAVICILSQISFITPSVPLTLQTLGVALCGFILSPKWALASICVYIGIGAMGLPVFSAFKGGFQVILGPTGGFIWGFIFLCLFCSLSGLCGKKALKIFLPLIGLALCHAVGVIQYGVVSGNGVLTALLTVSLPFLLKDVISIVLAYTLSQFIKKRIYRLNL